MNKTFLAAITCGSLLATCAAAPTERQTIPGHVPPATANLQPTGRLDAAKRLKLAIGLAPRDELGLDDFLRQLYDPANPAYHHYLTPKQFTERFSTSEADYEALLDYAVANGLTVTRKNANRVVLSVEGTVANIEKALHVTMRTYQHPTEARTFYAPDVEPSLALSVGILHISGLDNFTPPHPKNRHGSGVQKSAGTSHGTAPSGCGSGALWGWDYRNAYVPGTSLTGVGQIIGLLEFETYYPVDITNYWVNALGQPASTTPPVVTLAIDGTPSVNESDDEGEECSIDIEMGMAMAPGISKIYLFAGGPQASFDDIFESMVTYTNIRQFSCSWGGGTAADPTSEVLFKEMQTQGQSFFNATGDNGAFPIGTATLPSDSPSITQVGGSYLTDGPAPAYAWVSESAWSQDAGPNVSAANATSSSGGISAYYAIPYWQTGINMSTNLGSTSYRNYPDVSMNAEENNAICDNDGSIGSCGWGGTSFAAPMWAGLCALINQQAAEVGDAPVGFLNPALYALFSRTNAYTSYFHDITKGNNTWVDSPSEFYAEPGYDLVCGIGTPMGTNLINALLPPALQIQPAGSSLMAGPVGGPFSPTPQIFVLSNAGVESVTWALSNSASWLDVSPQGGTLPPNGATNLTASLDPGAANLAAEYFLGVVAISNLTVGSVQSIDFYLAVGLTNIQLGAYTAGQMVYAGQSAVFSVSLAAGNGASYQWQYVTNGTTNNLQNGVINNNSTLFGATTSSLTISNVLPLDAGFFTCSITNGVPSSANSPLAQLTVLLGAPALLLDLPSNETAIAESPTTISASFVGASPITYQWTYNGQPITNSTRISGATANVLTINPLLTGDAGAYQLLASNSFGTNASSLSILSVSSSLTFNNTAAGWTLNGTSEGGFIASNVLELTDGGGGEARSSFFSNQVNVSAFQARFTYKENAGSAGADGFTFCVQSDPRGAAAIGSSGNDLGYGGSPLIADSVAVEFNIYAAASEGVGVGFGSNGAIGAAFTNPPLVNITSGDPMNVTVTSAGGIINLILQDAKTTNTWSVITNINLPALVGSNAYVGFTGGDGSTVSVQTISNFLFTSDVPPTFALVPTNTVVAAGQSAPANFYAIALGATPLGYQWQLNGMDLTNGPSISGTGAIISGATSSNLTITGFTAADGGESYTVVATNLYGTNTAPSSGAAVLTVLAGPPVVAVNVQSNYTLYAGDSVATVKMAATFTGTVPITYQWTLNGQPVTNGAGFSGATSNVLTISPAALADAGTYQLLATNASGNGQSGQAVLFFATNLAFYNTLTGWSLNGTSEGGFVNSNVLELTADAVDETRSSFFSNQVYVGAFQATFTYQDLENSASSDGNGVCFVIQNDARGAAAAGTDGAALGYSNTTAGLKITPSVAVEFNVYAGNGLGGVGLAFGTNGIIGHTAGTSFVSLANGDPINVTINYYPGGQIGVALKDAITGLKFSTNVNINIPAVVGSSMAYVGFTGSTFGTNQESTQTISNFLLTTEYAPAFAVVPTNTTVTNGASPAIFYSSATGTAPLGYQWQLNGTNLTNGPSLSGSGAAIAGALSSNLTITGYTLADNAESYTVVVTNAYGTNSASAILTVLSNVVVAPPLLGGIVVSGAQFIFSYTTVAGASYQLESTTNLSLGVWVPAGGPVLGTGTPVSTTNNISSTGQQFFRLSITP